MVATGGFRVVALAGSLGGLEANCEILGAMPIELPAAIVISQHRGSANPGQFAAIIGRRCRLPVEAVAQGTVLRPGTVYVMPALGDATVTAGGSFQLDESKPAWPVRQADRLFESLANCYESAALAVVLSGSGSDGAAGSRLIKLRGGSLLVQSEDSCRMPMMPRAALATGCVDFELPLRALAAAIICLVMVPGARDFFQVALPPWVRMPIGSTDTGFRPPGRP
jgi:two-component system chemotaxis response regulator CheB